MRTPLAAVSAAAALAAVATFALAPTARASGAEEAALVASSYTLSSTQEVIKLRKGGTGVAKLNVKPNAGAHVSPDAPVTVLLSGGAALDFPKAKLTRADSKPTPEQGVEVLLPFTAKSAGTDTVKADLTFYICIKDLCARQQKSLSFAVAIE